MNWIKSLILIAVLAVGGVTSLSLDPVASTELEQCIKQGEECVISLRNIRPRRKLHISVEALFMIDFPTLKHKVSFFLDRKQQRITLDISAKGITESQHFDLPEVNETSNLRSLALHFKNERITLLLNCKEAASHVVGASLFSLYGQSKEPVIKLFRERKYPLHFDESLELALERGNCQGKDSPRRGNHHMLKSRMSEGEKAKKREIRNWYDRDVSERSVTHKPEVERGDIPIMHNDCEDALSKSLIDLLALIKLLREDIAQQRKEIDYLRKLLENCAGCKQPTSSSLVLEKNCRTANPCYPGVECHDSFMGPSCGSCPKGMIGDGRSCKHGISCAERPCFIGVRCTDTPNGPHCDACPMGYEGDGRSCKLRQTSSIMLPSHNIQQYHRQYTRKYSVVTS